MISVQRQRIRVMSFALLQRVCLTNMQCFGAMVLHAQAREAFFSSKCDVYAPRFCEQRQ